VQNLNISALKLHYEAPKRRSPKVYYNYFGKILKEMKKLNNSASNLNYEDLKAPKRRIS